MSQFRSVNDFDTPDELKEALRSNNHRHGFTDTRDFPRALIGSSVAVNGGVDIEADNMSVASEMSSVVEPDGELEWVLTNYHAETSHSQSLKEELKRLHVLKSYLILDSEREARFERLTGLASKIFQVPVALVSLVDLGRIWFMSNRGLGDVREISRDNAFCAHAIISKEDMLTVNDLTEDDRFKEHPLVVGWPNFRYYAGVPLLCPEGYKLGTFCLLDTKPRPSLTLDQKQMLQELATMVVSDMVDRRREKMRVLADKSHRLAATAHDLLTPLSGVQMSLSLLREDEELKHRLSENQMELVSTAESCAGVMNRICHSAMNTFRGELIASSGKSKHGLKRTASTATASSSENPTKQITIADFVQSLNMVMEPYPKQVPIFITVDPRIPKVIICDDLKLFRSALNLLTNAAKKTTSGTVQLNIYGSKVKESPKIVFECVDTGPGVDLALYPYLFRPFREEIGGRPEAFGSCIQVKGKTIVADGNSCAASMDNSGLGLYSVANQISSLGGEYGFRPRDEGSGAIFWFSIPLVVPRTVDTTSTRMPATNGSTSNSSSTVKTNHLANSHQTSFIPIENLSPTTTSPEDEANAATRALYNGTTSLKESDIPKLVNGKNVSHYSSGAPLEKRKWTELSKTQRIRQALVIDDSLVIRKSVSRAMKKLGFEVDVAANGLEGLKYLQANIYDITFCDYLMPVMDGLDCVQQYRGWESTHRPWIRQHIVGISAHASANDVEKGKDAGMDDFKAKPVTLKVLKELAEGEEICRIGERLDRLLDPLQDGDMDPVSDLEDHSWSTRSTKKQRMDVDVEPRDSGGKACLIAEESVGTVSSLVKAELDARGWQFVAVSDGEDALRLMKMRNWGVIYLDENLPRLTGVRCMERFRAWEAENRIKRQNSVFLVSASFVPSPSGDNPSSSGSFPSGFDGGLGKPVLAKDFRTLLRKAEGTISETASPADILHR